jgi:hypothetical protein
MRPPSLEDLAKEPLLGALAVVELALVMLARTLRGAHPDVDRAPRPGDDPETTVARQIVDDCDLLLQSLDGLRDHLYDRQRPNLTDRDWPF